MELLIPARGGLQRDSEEQPVDAVVGRGRDASSLQNRLVALENLQKGRWRATSSRVARVEDVDDEPDVWSGHGRGLRRSETTVRSVAPWLTAQGKVRGEEVRQQRGQLKLRCNSGIFTRCGFNQIIQSTQLNVDRCPHRGLGLGLVSSGLPR